MKKADLERLTKDELGQLRKDIDRAIKTFDEQQRKEALAAADAAAREKGFTLTQLTGGKFKKARGATPPKFQHPENPALTWSGRGRQPRWFKELTEAGTPEEELRIAS
jgi:DNA-binding protein H-NS